MLSFIEGEAERAEADTMRRQSDPRLPRPENRESPFWPRNPIQWYATGHLEVPKGWSPSISGSFDRLFARFNWFPMANVQKRILPRFEFPLNFRDVSRKKHRHVENSRDLFHGSEKSKYRCETKLNFFKKNDAKFVREKGLDESKDGEFQPRYFFDISSILIIIREKEKKGREKAVSRVEISSRVESP